MPTSESYDDFHLKRKELWTVYFSGSFDLQTFSFTKQEIIRCNSESHMYYRVYR